MEIIKNKETDTLSLEISGRIDTKTAPKLEDCLSAELEGVNMLIIDLKDVEYISSAGLRVLLIAQKKMNRQGEMKVLNVNNDIMEIFNVTGFSDILTIEQA